MAFPITIYRFARGRIWLTLLLLYREYIARDRFISDRNSLPFALFIILTRCGSVLSFCFDIYNFKKKKTVMYNFKKRKAVIKHIILKNIIILILF